MGTSAEASSTSSTRSNASRARLGDLRERGNTQQLAWQAPTSSQIARRHRDLETFGPRVAEAVAPDASASSRVVESPRRGPRALRHRDSATGADSTGSRPQRLHRSSEPSSGRSSRPHVFQSPRRSGRGQGEFRPLRWQSAEFPRGCTCDPQRDGSRPPSGLSLSGLVSPSAGRRRQDHLRASRRRTTRASAAAAGHPGTGVA